MSSSSAYVFFFHDPATTEIYTLSLHDALPISPRFGSGRQDVGLDRVARHVEACVRHGGLRTAVIALADRKSTRLNSSHSSISYAVFCLKKKKKNITRARHVSAPEVPDLFPAHT